MAACRGVLAPGDRGSPGMAALPTDTDGLHSGKLARSGTAMTQPFLPGAPRGLVLATLEATLGDSPANA